MEEKEKTSIEPQLRLNTHMKEVVKAKVLKLLDAGIIYPISNSNWVSPMRIFPKKGGLVVVKNEKDELIATRTVIGWSMCIDYHRINRNTRKNHFPLLQIDQMLERLAGYSYYCFLDGNSGYNEIPQAPDEVEEKTIFTCPFGTYAYKQIPFGLCNAPDTFQRCLMLILTKFVEKTIEIFMDDFLVVGPSFEDCLSNLK